MDHNRAASHIRVFTGDALTAACQAEARSENRPVGAVTSYGRWPFAPCAADLWKYARELQDAGVELLCGWDKPPRNAARVQDPAVRRRRAA